MGDPQAPAEDPVLVQVRRTAGLLVGRIKPLASLKIKGPGVYDELEQAVKAAGDPATFAQALKETLSQAAEVSRNARSTRSAAFSSSLAAFRRGLTDREMRETAAGWRVGPLELEVRPEEGTLRARYNREPMTAWTPIRTPEDIADLVGKAEKTLADQALPREELARAFHDAWHHLVTGGSPDASSQRIAIRELLAEVRVVLFRSAMRERRRADARAAADMPSWALLYNTDRYRAAAGEFAADQRLRFETGSQRETGKIGVTLNGLEASRQYETLCFVRRAGAS